MAVNPEIDADGVPTLPRRPPLTGRQRVWIIVTILAIAVLAVALTGLMGPHKRPISTSERGVSVGMPFTVPTEPKVVEKPPVLPAAAPSFQKLTPISGTAPTADHALTAPLALGNSETGSTSVKARAVAGGDGGKEKDDEFTAQMTASSVGAAAKAHRMKHPSLTVPAGIVIPCVLQTAINSQLAGFVDCVLPSEVRSADGTVTLMDKGTTVMGQIRSGLTKGQERLFILWSRARTPDNITVELASPAADELGRAGVGCNNDGDCVNTHFWKMFWTAALYSLVEYGPAAGIAALQNNNHGNTTFVNPGFLTPQQSLAQTVLQDQLHIPPTLEKNIGDAVSIFVARDLVFDQVYDLKMVN